MLCDARARIEAALYATPARGKKELTTAPALQLCLNLKVQGQQQFPTGFFWGAATAAHQIEGNNVNSDWWQSEQRGLLPYRSGDACDSWRRWPDDIRLL